MALKETDIAYGCLPSCKVKGYAPLLLMLLCLFFIASCESGTGAKDDDLGASSTLSRSENNQLVLPPDVNSGDSANPRQKLEGLKGLKGVNVDQLFSQNIRDTDKRFDRIEDAFVDFRKEFEAVKPEIVRLVAIEKDIQTLIDMLGQDLNVPAQSPHFANTPVMPGPETAPVPLDDPEFNELVEEEDTAPPEDMSVHQAEQPVAKTPSAPAAPPAVTLTNFRYGEHETYTRFVIDATGATSYNASIDSSGKNLIIKVPSSAWNGGTSKTYNHHLLNSYHVESTGGETTITASFKQSVTLTNQGTLTKDTAPRFRIFVDVR